MQLFKKYADTCHKLGMREEPKIFKNVKNAKVKKLRSVNMIHKKVNDRKLTPATIGSEIKKAEVGEWILELSAMRYLIVQAKQYSFNVLELK